MNKVIIAGFIMAIFGAVESVAQKNLPNVIIIMSDDQGYADVGFNGCKDIKTPHLDRLAANGVVFTNGYVSHAFCGPSRAGLITGRYQHRFGFERNPLLAPNDPDMGLPLSEETMATVMGRAGYRSMIAGKWHLGAHESLHPLKRGFDEFYGFLNGGHQYFPEAWTLNDLTEIKTQYDGYKTKLLRDYTRVEEKEYITDALSREAVGFIERNKEQPFFLYLAYNAPHGPLQATEKYLDRYKHIEDMKRRTYAAMVSAVDDGVGMVLDKLEELGIEENTMVFFLSDNGGPEHVNASDNGPLKGGKGRIDEGGIRVPFAMQWPAQIKAGTTYDFPVISLDIFATAVAYAKPSLNPEKPLDGVNIVPFINKNQEAHQSLYWRMRDSNSLALRNENLKFVMANGGEITLYDLSKDIGETKDIKEKNKATFEELKRKYDRWDSQLIEPIFWGLSQEKEYLVDHPDRFIFKK